MAEVFKRFPPPVAECVWACVWARGVCLPVYASRSLPGGWLLRVMFTCALSPRPWERRAFNNVQRKVPGAFPFPLQKENVLGEQSSRRGPT